MQFCPWYPATEIAERTPAGPGVFQLKIARGLLEYPRGKSAMVAYGAGDDLRAAALAAAVDSSLLCRHVETGDAGAAEALLAELTDRFIRRFGRAPGPGD